MVQFYSPRRRSIATDNFPEVTIETLDALGQGVARYTDSKAEVKTLFVTNALPGERVKVRLLEDKRRYAKGEALKWLNRSPERCVPACRHFGQCGGCVQQHVPPMLQHQSKTAALHHLLQRELGEIPVPSSALIGQHYHYRRRVRLGLQYCIKSKQLRMGFRQVESNILVEITVCPVICQVLESLLKPLHQCLSALQGVKELGHVELVAADNGVQLILRHLSPLSIEDRHLLLQFSQENQLSIWLQGEARIAELLWGWEPYYQIDGLSLSFSPQNFIQVNAGINQQMVAQAVEWLELKAEDRVLDLFCGMGNFTLPIAQYAGTVVGVEGVPELVEKARTNAQNNQLENVEFYHENLQENLINQSWSASVFDKVILDPARAGAEEVMATIITLAPTHIVYVSCHPATLARDSKRLLAANYQLIDVKMLDMFPHTGHFESMALFKKDYTKNNSSCRKVATQ